MFGRMMLLTVPQTVATIPDAPNFTSWTDSPAQLTGIWDASAGATSYNLYVRAGAAPTTSTYDFLYTEATSPYTINGPLTAGITYYAKVTASNGVGESTMSAGRSAVAAADTTYFASDYEGWTPTHLERSQGAAHDGTWSVYGTHEGFYDEDEDTDARGWLGLAQTIAIPSSTTITFWYKASEGHGYAIFLDEGIIEGTIIADNTWRQVSYTTTATSTFIEIQLNSDLGAGNFVTGYIDDIGGI